VYDACSEGFLDTRIIMPSKSQNKTVPTKVSVRDFLESGDFSVEDQKAAKTLVALFEKVTKKKCVMWGKIFGFGQYHYKSVSREGEWMATGFALRKNAITVYIMCGLSLQKDLLKALGKHKLSGGSCLYIHKLADVDLSILEKIIKHGFQELRKKNHIT
jgi:hypothetical protein